MAGYSLPPSITTDDVQEENILSLGDEWGDGKLTARDGAKVTPSTLDRQALAFRPEWDTVSGSPSVSVGQLELADGSVTVQMVGTTLPTPVPRAFEVTVDTPSGGGSGDMQAGIGSLADGVSNGSYHGGYHMEISSASSNNFRLIEESTGGSETNLINGTWDRDGGVHTFGWEFSPDGTFELFYDGASQGTATHTGHYPTRRVGIGNNRDAAHQIQSVKVEA